MFRTITRFVVALPLVACTAVDVQLHATEGGSVRIESSEQAGSVDCTVYNDGEGMTGDCEADETGAIVSYEGEPEDADTLGSVIVELTATADEGFAFTEWQGCDQVDEETGLVFMAVDDDDSSVCNVFHQELSQTTSLTLADTIDEANVVAVFDAAE